MNSCFGLSLEVGYALHTGIYSWHSIQKKSLWLALFNFKMQVVHLQLLPSFGGGEYTHIYEHAKTNKNQSLNFKKVHTFEI